MTGFRRTTSQDSEPSVGRSPADGVTRLARFAGRLLLWGCVLLLLIRGIASYLNGNPRALTTTRGATVTVTQPVSTEPSTARRK